MKYIKHFEDIKPFDFQEDWEEKTISNDEPITIEDIFKGNIIIGNQDVTEKPLGVYPMIRGKKYVEKDKKYTILKTNRSVDFPIRGTTSYFSIIDGNGDATYDFSVRRHLRYFKKNEVNESFDFQEDWEDEEKSDILLYINPDSETEYSDRVWIKIDSEEDLENFLMYLEEMGVTYVTGKLPTKYKISRSTYTGKPYLLYLFYRKSPSGGGEIKMMYTSGSTNCRVVDLNEIKF